MKPPSEQYEEETGKYHYNSSNIDFEYSCDYVDWLEQKYMNQAKNNEVLDLVSLCLPTKDDCDVCFEHETDSEEKKTRMV
tara:strand:+ start:361 stop:600 length:240 start_codon:yes stop_codon:yes gene_type:complete